jgi:hypothetical protein
MNGGKSGDDLTEILCRVLSKLNVKSATKIGMYWFVRSYQRDLLVTYIADWAVAHIRAKASASPLYESKYSRPMIKKEDK